MQDSKDSGKQEGTGGMGADSSAIDLDEVIAGLKKITPGLPYS